jgi:ubiquinone/menaquinone biosynthesis C-methylase UbiE
MLEEFTKANLALWNELTGIHAGSEFYDVQGFKAGKQSLGGIELQEIGGEVAGKTLLHLQCHFGLDTLSLARLGAVATGVDFSDQAIALARRLSQEVAVPATFVHADVNRLPEVLDERFDIVFTSWGVLIWLGDLDRWAAVVAHFLKPGGTFYIAEFHPFVWALDDGESPVRPRPASAPPPADELRVGYPCFPQLQPFEFDDAGGSYADPTAHVSASKSYEWTHSLGEIVTLLVSHGLVIEYLHEFPRAIGLRLPFVIEGKDGWQHVKGHEESFPLSFSIRATKRAGG